MVTSTPDKATVHSVLDKSLLGQVPEAVDVSTFCLALVQLFFELLKSEDGVAGQEPQNLPARKQANL